MKCWPTLLISSDFVFIIVNNIDKFNLLLDYIITFLLIHVFMVKLPVGIV